MKSRIALKPCPFCGSPVIIRRGLNNVTFFECRNDECCALVSFGGDKKLGFDTTEARDPIGNYNRRGADKMYDNARQIIANEVSQFLQDAGFEDASKAVDCEFEL